MDIKELEQRVLLWADERNILDPNNKIAQHEKTLEEVSELGQAIIRKDYGEVLDGIGDTIVTLIIQANLWGTNLEECLELAYDEIKDRTGKTVDGVFIKD